MKNVQFAGNNCEIKKSKYSTNGNLALMLFDKETGQKVSNVTINTLQRMDEDVAAVKDYSENEGMLEAITEAGLIKNDLGSIQVGFTMCNIVRFDLSEVDEI